MNKQIVIITNEGRSALRTVPSEVALRLPRGIVREDLLQQELEKHYNKQATQPLTHTMADKLKGLKL